MPAGVQPANRKLLDDVTAGAQVPNTATPLGAALATLLAPKLDAATYTAQKGAASGIATLGVDGKVPAAQLPVAASTGALLVGKAVNTSRASTTTLAADPELSFPTVATGVYALEGMIVAGFSSGNLKLSLTGTATASAAYATWGGQAVGGAAGLVALTWNTAASRATPGSSDPAGRIVVLGTLTVTVAGTVRLDWAQNTSDATATIVAAGSWLRLSRLG